MANDVNITMSAKDSDVIRMIEKLNAGLDKTAKRLGDVEKNSTKSKGTVSAAVGNPKLVKDVDKFTKSLRLQAHTFGMTGREAAIYKLQMEGATVQQLAMARALDKRLTSMEKEKSKVGGIGRAAKNMTGQLATGLVGIGSAAGAVLAVVAAIKSEMEELKQRQERSRVTTVSAGQALRTLRDNFLPDASLKAADIDKVVKDLAEETRSSVPIVAAALGDAMSAKGASDNAAAVEAVRQALRNDPSDPAKAASLASRFLDISNKGGGSDMKAIAGFLQNVQGTARVTSLEALGQNLVPAITSLTNNGDSLEQAAELVATMTTLMNDAEGRLSATAMINLGTKMEDFVVNKEKSGEFRGKFRGSDKRGDFAIPEEQVKAFEKATSTQQRIQVMQNSAELRRAFLGQTTFEARARNPVAALLSGEKNALATQKNSELQIKGISAEQSASFDAKIKEKEKARFQGALTAEQQLQANIEKKQLESTLDQRTATAVMIRDKTFAETNIAGPDWIREQALKYDNPISSDDPETGAIAQLEELLIDLKKSGTQQKEIELTEANLKLLREQQEQAQKNHGELLKEMQKMTAAIIQQGSKGQRRVPRPSDPSVR